MIFHILDLPDSVLTATLQLADCHHLTTNQIKIIESIFRQFDQLIVFDHYSRITQVFGVIGIIEPGKLQNDASLVWPSIFKAYCQHLAIRFFDLCRFESFEALWKIRQQIGNNFTAKSLWPGDSSNFLRPAAWAFYRENALRWRASESLQLIDFIGADERA